MKAIFSGQPFPEHSPNGQAGDLVTALLADERFTHFEFASAWVKRSGLSRLSEALSTFRARGGTASGVLGIDEGGATRQGLQLALELLDEVFVYHDNSWRTFHPKVYVFSGSEAASVLIGSNNLTAGGLYSNFEAFSLITLDRSLGEDSALLQSVDDWFATLKSDGGRSKRLSLELLEALVTSVGYRVGDEDAARGSGGGGDDDDHDSLVPPTAMSLFGPGGTLLSGPPVTRAAQHGAAVPAAAHAPASGGVFDRAAPSEAIWSKTLSRADAQRPLSSNTAPTGRLTLTRSTYPIDHTTYFRQDFFAGLDWVSTQRQGHVFEEATLVAAVGIGGKSRGTMTFRIDHAAHREADQGNVTTWLHWDALGAVLRDEIDTSGGVVIIRRHSDGGFSLELDSGDES